MITGELQLASNMQAESDNDKHASHPKMKVIMICYHAHTLHIKYFFIQPYYLKITGVTHFIFIYTYHNEKENKEKKCYFCFML